MSPKPPTVGTNVYCGVSSIICSVMQNIPVLRPDFRLFRVMRGSATLLTSSVNKFVFSGCYVLTTTRLFYFLRFFSFVRVRQKASRLASSCCTYYFSFSSSSAFLSMLDFLMKLRVDRTTLSASESALLAYDDALVILSSTSLSV